jgi:hypothetical protein
MTDAPFEARGKSHAELLQLKLQLEGELATIRRQLDHAKAEARASGKFANPSWWAKAHQALRRKGRQCQQVQMELGRLRKARIRSVEGHFLDVCRERMGGDPNFKSFLETAKRRAL